ncbi:amidohydrolase [Parvularcula maris]|uniref:Amidohydrolase n=1 Tax=Parvularcula maris TaxID=2965077 RepID=A0A9X2RKY3_9PROT|nr:amidohydrolase [Parvularcula maris]MCQ8186258.1 amidohydrolase [Parvularcula maris]
MTMRRLLMGIGLAGLAACGSGEDGRSAYPNPDPFPSTYEPYPSENMVIQGATILTGTGKRIENGSVLVLGGKIQAVGEAGELDVPRGFTVVDAEGKYVTPGIIDLHSHLGVYPSPSNASTSDGNEATSPNTAGVWAEHSIFPQDAGFGRALAGGITSLHIMPGSANLFGGRTVTVKNVPSRTVQGMKFPGAPYGIKMACGENPKRVYGSRGGPATRMGNFRGYRQAWIDAKAYKDEWDGYARSVEAGEGGKAPRRDLDKETLAGVLAGDIIVHMHCYRGDEMVQVLDMAEEFGYEVGTFHHAIEAYKVADILAENDVCAAVWADWWGFKLEAYDAVRENAALVANQPNGCVVIHSDDPNGVQRLNQEAAKAMADGRALGIDIAPEEAITWITANPAKAAGILDRTGTLESGKDADLVIWDQDPFSVYARPEKVFVDGALMFDREDETRQPVFDYELGQSALEDA